jgi:uncharacterized protein
VGARKKIWLSAHIGHRSGDPAMDTVAPFTRHDITLPLDQIAELCRKYQVVELSVFGSLLRDDFGPESDIDFLVVFQNDDYGPWMGKLQGMEEDLGALLGREVELVPKESVLRSENWIRRKHILSTAQVIYGS